MTAANDGPTPNDPLDGLAEKLIALPAADRAALAFSDSILDAAAALHAARATQRYMSIKALIRKAQVGLAEWEREVKRRASARARPADWRGDLSTDGRGRPEATEDNIVRVLTHAPEWVGVLAFDAFANNIVMRQPPPWHDDVAGADGAKAGPWKAGDDARLVCWLQREIGMHAKVLPVMAALQLVAEHNAYDPVRDYLDSLPEWDSTPRLGTWLQVYAGGTAESARYLARVGTMFVISMVARICDPGCQVHHCIIFEGAQGAGKSSAARALVPNPEWFAEHNANIGDKDAMMILAGRWVVEMAELDALGKAEITKMKRYMTDANDTYRTPYDRRVSRFPRRCVFVGTTNDSEYLRDPTGNRRFWPVKVGDVDVAGIARDRDQLFAEALFRYRQGEEFWPQADDVGMFTDEQELRFRPDPWETPIADWLEKWSSRTVTARDAEHEGFITTDLLLKKAVGKDRADQTDGDGVRIGRIMARLRWTRSRSRSANEDGAREGCDGGGKRRRIPIYLPPA